MIQYRVKTCSSESRFSYSPRVIDLTSGLFCSDPSTEGVFSTLAEAEASLPNNDLVDIYVTDAWGRGKLLLMTWHEIDAEELDEDGDLIQADTVYQSELPQSFELYGDRFNRYKSTSTFYRFEPSEAKDFAERLRESSNWDPSDCEALCELAGLSDEWDAADGDNFEQVVYKAAEILGVDL